MCRNSVNLYNNLVSSHGLKINTTSFFCIFAQGLFDAVMTVFSPAKAL